VYGRLLDIVHRWQDPNQVAPIVMIVGDFMVDNYLFGDAARISPEAPVPILNITRQEMRLGGAGGVANNLLVLGAKVICCGLIGDDQAGQFIVQQLENQGADTSGLVKLEEYQTIVKQRLIGLAGGKIPQQLLRADYEANGHVSGQVAEQLIRRTIELASRAEIVAVEDYDKGAVNKALIGKLSSYCRELKVQTVVDPARLGDYERYRGIDWVLPNRLEANLATSIQIRSTQAAQQAAKTMIDRWGFSAVFIKLDREGICVFTSDGRWRQLPTHARDVYDVTGAGDMVLAALVMARAGGAELFDAAAIANVAGGLEIEQLGSQPIYPEQIAEYLFSRHREHFGKIRSIEELLAELHVHRKLGRKVAFTNGCFDLLHPGHVSYLESAAEHGDVLVVGMNTDKSVQTLKGPNRPITPQVERARMLAALEVVDYVVMFDDTSVEPLLRQVKPDVLIKGDDYGLNGVVGRNFVESYGGKVALAKIERAYSTTKIIQRIVERAGNEGSDRA